MPHAMGDVSGIGISIGIAAANSIGYQVPARLRSNPSTYFNLLLLLLLLLLQQLLLLLLLPALQLLLSFA